MRIWAMTRSHVGVLAVASVCAASVAGCVVIHDDRAKTANSTSAPATTPAGDSTTKPAVTEKSDTTKTASRRSGGCPKADQLKVTDKQTRDKARQSVTIRGATGTATVSEAGPGEMPKFTFKDSPFTVTTTGVAILNPGSGEVVPVGSNVAVEYYGVNGRDGNNFDSSYKRGKTATFPLKAVIKGFRNAIQCQRTGTRLVVAIPPEDGYGARGNPKADIQGTDTMLFYIEIKAIDEGS